MEQTFEYPNLVAGTRSGQGWLGGDAGGGYDPDKGIALYNSKTTEVSLYSPTLVMHTGTDYTLHCFAASTANMSSTEFFVLCMDGGQVGAHVAFKNPGPEGAWLDATFRIYDVMPDGGTFKLRFDNNGSTDGQRCSIWFRDVMLVEGTEPHAWAPAEGEVWP